MKLSLDSDGSRRMPAIDAGVFKPLQKFAKSNFAQVAPLKSGLTLQQKKYLIGALMALNLGLIGATVARDHTSRMQDVRAIESMFAATTEQNRVAVKPVKKPTTVTTAISVVEATPTPAPTPKPTTAVAGVSISRFSGDVRGMLYASTVARWGEAQWSAMNALIGRESGLNPYAVNPTSGACGIPQAYPCSKLLNVIGSLDNVQGQIDWLINYVANRYGTPSGALAHHHSTGWY